MSRALEPRGLLLRPELLGCVLLFAVNDALLKAAYPGWLTGKLSDVGLLVVAPVWLFVALCWLIPRYTEEDPASCAPELVARQRFAALVASIVLVGGLFTAMQLTAAGDAFFRHGLGYLQWPARVCWALVRGVTLPAAAPVKATPDPTDLLCLPMLGVAWWLVVRRSRQ